MEAVNSYLFVAKIFPQIENWHLKYETTLLVDPLGQLHIEVQFNNSDITIKAATKDAIDIYCLRNVIETFCKSTMDCLGYLEGFPFHVIVSRNVVHNGAPVALALGPIDLINTRLDRPFAGNYDAMLKCASESFELRSAASNLRQAILASNDTGLYCFRAIECLRQRFHTKDREDKESSRQKEQTWKRLSKALRIDKTWFDEIRAYSEFQRHGAPRFMSDEARSVLLLRTTQVVDRYCLFMSLSSVPEELPVLACNGVGKGAKCLDPQCHTPGKGKQSEEA